jgi:hypothetical protein
MALPVSRASCCGPCQAGLWQVCPSAGAQTCPQKLCMNVPVCDLSTWRALRQIILFFFFLLTTIEFEDAPYSC